MDKNQVLKLLEKEHKLGYTDASIFGGFAENLAKSISKNGTLSFLLPYLVMYKKSSINKRKQIMGQMLSEIRKMKSDIVLPDKLFMGKKESIYNEIELQYLKGVGPKRAIALGKLGIKNVSDLIEYYPKRHEDRTVITDIDSLNIGEEALICGYVVDIDEVHTAKLTILKVTLADDTGSIVCIWFNQRYLKDKMKPHTRLYVYGRKEVNYGRPQFNVIEFSFYDDDPLFPGILPVYALTEGITQSLMRNIVKSALHQLDGVVTDYIPRYILDKYDFSDLWWSIKQYHYPDNAENLLKARQRLVFNEFFLMKIAAGKKYLIESMAGISHKAKVNREFSGLLPFKLTDAQKRVIEEIDQDMSGNKRMQRLLQGDVGSGKTVVASYAAYKAIKSGYQVAFMVPTEILAEQHYKLLCQLFEESDINIAIISGTTKKREKEQIYKDVAGGIVDLIVGTHALIEDKVVFNSLGLVIIDEQHRFGVRQRERLLEKGIAPDLLVLSATPIPRTLAMTIYSNYGLSVIDQLPPGRKSITTYLIGKNKEQGAFKFIKDQIYQGYQAYIICPLIEESEQMDLVAATELYNRLHNNEYSDLSIALLHGSMKAKDKDRIMDEFRDNKIQVLISTTVIEVGVDVPNATVMMIRDAERFGLAQLHQIRGRVGRGSNKSYCILQHNARSKISMDRLNVMKESQDGFYIAQKDLELRGSGDFFGTRQHGIPGLKLADLYLDSEILELSDIIAKEILTTNPMLNGDEFMKLREVVAKKYVTDRN